MIMPHEQECHFNMRDSRTGIQYQKTCWLRSVLFEVGAHVLQIVAGTAHGCENVIGRGLSCLPQGPGNARARARGAIGQCHAGLVRPDGTVVGDDFGRHGLVGQRLGHKLDTGGTGGLLHRLGGKAGGHFVIGAIA